MKIIADMHVHTNFSVDAEDDMRNMCQSAVNKGLSYICFTEHYDLNPKDIGYGYFNYEEFSKAIDAVKKEFGNKINILKGIEFGEPHLYPRDFEDIRKKDFDVILGSVHWFLDHFAGDDILKEKYEIGHIFEKYYEEVLKMVEFGGFNVLAHLDFPKRYLKVSHDCSIIDEILCKLSKSDIVLEINTSPLRKGLNECAPDSELLKRYVKLGGNKVTIGSDAHSCNEIAADFDSAFNLLKDCGITKAGLFRGQKFFTEC